MSTSAPITGLITSVINEARSMAIMALVSRLLAKTLAQRTNP